MLLRALEHLVCPLDKTPLDLVEWETVPLNLSAEDIGRAKRLGIDPTYLSHHVLTGVLLNRTRKVFYPIYKGIPRMLVFQTGVTRHFVDTYRERIARELKAFRLPSEPAVPGEESVLRTFSTEWVNYDWDGLSYWNLSADEMYKSMVFMLDL